MITLISLRYYLFKSDIKMTDIITTKELKEKIEKEGDFYLIDTLSPGSFETHHIPKAKNVPNGPDLLKRVENEINPDKNDEIIVYCSSSGCMASVQVVSILKEAGYSNVMHYKDGLAGWQDAGYKFEGKDNATETVH